MKKIIATVLTLILATTCLFSATVVTSAADTAIPEGLVMAFDFEGDDAATQLADKATSGSVKDDLNVAGTVTVENGVAVVSSEKSSQLKATSSEDLKNLTGYTVYVKLKATGEYGANWTNPIQLTKAFRMIIVGKADGSYTLQGRANASFDTQHPVPGVLTFKEGEWFYAAYTAAIEDGKLKTATYYSADGVTYIGETKDYDVTYTTMNSLDAIFGQKQDGTIEMSFDDIMIFNRALSADEVKTLSSVELPTPQPVETEPVETDPVDTDPVVTDPVETDPVETDPVETDPIETDPIETTPDSGDDTAADTDEEEKSGCGGVIGIGTAALAIAAFGMAVCAKKKEN